MFDIINTLTEEDIKENFVAIGTYIDENKTPYHAVIVVKFDTVIEHIHYTGKEILFDNIYDETCFHKITDTIPTALIPSFIVMCNNVMKKANPSYGYFYSGEYYDQNGNHFSEKAIKERMTCSGFCLNLLKGYLEEDYLYYQEWEKSSYPSENYLKNYAKRNGLEIDDISESHRRISPLEMLCSAYFKNLPIRKFQIDSKKDETQEYLKNY